MTNDADDLGAQLFTGLCFLMGVVLCALRFGQLIGLMVFFLGVAIFGECRRIAKVLSDRQGEK